MRPSKPLFEVHKAKVPNGKRYWYIVGRPQGKRVRAWFSSEKEASAEAKKRNKELTEYGMKALSLTASQRAQAEEALQILETVRVNPRRRGKRCRSTIAGCSEINHDKGTSRTGNGVLSGNVRPR